MNRALHFSPRRAVAALERAVASGSFGSDPGRTGRPADPGSLFQDQRWPAPGQHQPLGAHPATSNVAVQGEKHPNGGDYPFFLRRAFGERIWGRRGFLHRALRRSVSDDQRKVAGPGGTNRGTSSAAYCWRACARPMAAGDHRARGCGVRCDLPVRKDYPRSMEEAKKILETARRQFHETRDSSAPDKWKRLKSLSEEIERLSYSTQGMCSI